MMMMMMIILGMNFSAFKLKRQHALFGCRARVFFVASDSDRVDVSLCIYTEHGALQRRAHDSSRSHTSSVQQSRQMPPSEM